MVVLWFVGKTQYRNIGWCIRLNHQTFGDRNYLLQWWTSQTWYYDRILKTLSIKFFILFFFWCRCYMLCCRYFLSVSSTAMFWTKIQGEQILGFFHVFIIPRNSSNNSMKLDNALTQRGELGFFVRGAVGGKFKRCNTIRFPHGRRHHHHRRLLTEGVQPKRDHWPLEFSARATIKFQIGIASFSLRFIVPNPGTPFRLERIETSRHWGGRSSSGRPPPGRRGVLFFGVCFQSLFLTSSAFHCFQGRILD